MSEPGTNDTRDIADALFDIIPRLLDHIRADIPRASDDLAPSGATL
ncbi:hypothetical protein [Ktedonosporobacter rubrisoli]|nr:hypothetical protein [Ktedonosporobacter rubrisoli]